MQERSQTSLQLEALRDVYKNRDYSHALGLARQAIKDSPQSIIAHIVKGDAELELGRITEAYHSHLQADQLYQNRMPLSAPSADYIRLQKNLVATAVVLGDYQDARGRGIALRRNGDSTFTESAKLSPQELKSAMQKARNNKDYAKVVNLAQNYFIRTGAEDTEVALMFANSLLMNPQTVSLKDLIAANTIARGVLKKHKDIPAAWNILGFVYEIALNHPQREFIHRGETRNPELRGITGSRAGLLMFYRKALAIDPKNTVALERYRELRGKKYEPKPWIKTLIEEDYEPESYLIPVVSEQLKKNAEAHINEEAETARYWACHDPNYQRLIASLDSQINAQMHPACRIAICIPAYNEGKNIYETLETYSRQKGIKPEEFEVIILENHKAIPGKTRDNTREEVNRFKADHPQMKVRRVFHAFPLKGAALGNIRKTVFDLAVYRNMQRRKENPGKSFILASNDADNYGMKENGLSYMLELFDSQTRLDIMSGRRDFPEEAYLKFPVLHAISRFASFHYSIRTQYVGNGHLLASCGSCTYFRSGMYAAVGGYAYKVETGSDTEFGRRVAYYRGESPKRRLVNLNALRVFTDPRRALSKMVMGGHLVDEWKDRKNWQEDKRVLGKSWRDFEDPTLTSFNKKRLQEELNAYLEERAHVIIKNPSSNAAKIELAVIGRALNLIGVDKYHFQGGKIVLEDTSRLEKYLKGFRLRP